ncbi:hypothetical protein K144316041_23150 [Clostridium tetani]|nr:hypothetical protein [Clostridium tetani]BDR73607.1 hypothetical protein K144316041_23150 [Clostridium tetani]BDR84854.1 hypothetical protein K254310026_22650 [Clostridium tetani]
MVKEDETLKNEMQKLLMKLNREDMQKLLNEALKEIKEKTVPQLI